ncbi:MAG: histidinol dehydrogenase [Clostridiaceae bacterium]|jgi:histidinol dehydrogenase|nr:histidinol dehydrogenase [Clostridiaceae bacterium]
MKVFSSTEYDIEQLIKMLRKRSSDEQTDVTEAVREILTEVRVKGDEAVSYYTEKFDRAKLANFEIGKDVIKQAYDSLSIGMTSTIEKAAENIRKFHQMQSENSWFESSEEGVLLGQKITPLERVGVYVPGGTAPLPSSVLMNVIPAKVAGVKEIIMCTPPYNGGYPDPVILACAYIAGVDRVFSIGGAQAIAAMAYGTQTIPKVDKVTGPGNIFVATAKKMVYGVCDIDMIAGPSEILIIADKTARPEYVAADLLSQAEHDVLASSILISDSNGLIEDVISQIDKQKQKLPRKDFIDKSLKNYGAAILVSSLKEAVELSNMIAPEHLELIVQEPFSLLGNVKNAGAIFLGEYSPEPLGDYMAGPNHILPTNGTARFFSPLSVNDFTKKSSIISYSKDALRGLSKDLVRFAQTEGLDAHANSIKIRFED